MKVREPVARPLDVVGLELLLSSSQAFVVGVLMYLAIGVWDDRGVGLGSVAVILALLGLAVGGGWLYWVLGGVGWPMAAANVPVAMFLGFALVLAWAGDDLFRVAGVPLLLAVLGSVYGVVGGVFIESPRRWRWDQRRKLRKGTVVPRVSPATRTLIAALPRSLPQRDPAPDPSRGLAARIEQSNLSAAEPGPANEVPHAQPEGGTARPTERSVADDEDSPEKPGTGAATAERDAPGASGGLPTMPTERLEAGARNVPVRDSKVEGDEEPVSIELPTAVEPSAQRSPWAWAAPPEWNRDEDDAGTPTRPSRRS